MVAGKQKTGCFKVKTYRHYIRYCHALPPAFNGKAASIAVVTTQWKQALATTVGIFIHLQKSLLPWLGSQSEGTQKQKHTNLGGSQHNSQNAISIRSPALQRSQNAWRRMSLGSWLTAQTNLRLRRELPKQGRRDRERTAWSPLSDGWPAH